MRKTNIDNLASLHNRYVSQDNDEIIMPAYYIIEPTNNCNFACSICPNRLYKVNERGQMSLDLFYSIINQIKDLAEVIQLYWVGEPLLHPDIFEMIRVCKEKTRAKIMLSTNGSLMSEDTIKKLIESGLDKLIVSMDAAESSIIYNSIRVNGNIEELNHNVSKLIDYTEKIDITLQFILTNLNESERDAFIKKWGKENVKVSIQCLYTWANQLPELGEMSRYLSPMIGQKRIPCADLWYKMAIHWNGVVSRCCFDWSFNNILGDLKKQSVCDVWNSKIINELRTKHRSFLFDSLCANCDAWATEDEYETLFD